MSLEQALADNTAAIRELIAAMRPAAPATVTAVVQAITAPAADTSKIVLIDPDEKAAPEVPYVMPPLQPREAVVEAPAALAAIEYAQVAQAIIDAFKADRAKVIAALGKFGAKKGPELKPADYAAFLEELA
ncbi:MAG: hypothetical protein EBY28_24880 [Betaproteobacteria bacterium]|nr:hypothetical protein [Betaproteobacteria bacterium]